MKVEITKEKLHTAISKAERVTGKNLALPVLSCILIEAKDKQIIVRATNLDLGLEIVIPARISVPGQVAVPGPVLAGLLSNLPEGPLHMEEKEGNLVLLAGESVANIKCYPTEDFPTIPKIKDSVVHELNSLDLVGGLKSVWYSASVSGIKPELSSVYIYPDDEGLVFVATDSFRLAEKKIRTKKKHDFEQVLIPFKNVVDLLKVVGDEKLGIEVGFGKNQVSFDCGDVYLVSRVVDGVFPDYKQIIPKEFKTEIVVLKQDLVRALKLSNVFSDSFNQINIKADPTKKTLEFKTRNTSVGEGVNKLSAVVTGETIEINFNHKYIVDCFQSIDSDSVSLSFSGLNKPMVIRGVSDKSFTYLVMPMNR